MLLERPVLLRCGGIWKFSIAAGIAAIVVAGLLSTLRLDTSPGNGTAPKVQLAVAQQNDVSAKDEKPAVKQPPQKPEATPADKGERRSGEEVSAMTAV